MPIEYKKEIHEIALSIIEHRKNVARYEDDCLNAGICAKCGYRLITQTSETRRDAMGLLDETICMKCGHLAQLN